MQKLLVTISAALWLTACATSMPEVNNNQIKTLACEDNGQVTAAYSANGQVANLKLSLPKVGINNKNITLTQAVSASGARYTSDADSTVSYDWHTKADFGVMSVRMANNQEYSVSCR